MKLFVIFICAAISLFFSTSDSVVEAQNSTEGSENAENNEGNSTEEEEEGEDPTRRIVGGNFANSGQFPFLVSLRLKDAHFCGGAILGLRWVLTAAHCFDRKLKYINNAYVIIGTLKLTERGQRREIEGLLPHKQYDERTFTNDICLVRVHPNIVYSDTIQPITIVRQPPALGTYVTIIGWGDTQYEGNLSTDLKYTFLQILPNWQCKRMFQRYMSDTLMCGLAGPGEGTCNGDSGGPLIQNGNLVGVSVWGLYCAAGYPDTFTRLHLYVDWISANTQHYDAGPQNTMI